MSCSNHFAAPGLWRLFLLPLALTLLHGQPVAGGPAATRIAVSVDATADHHSSRILVGSSDGTDLSPITDGTSHDRSPSFSPDGKLLSYQSTNDLGLENIIIRPLSEPSTARVLAAGRYPQWSRDSQRILFSRPNLNEHNLYVIRADGSQAENGLKPLIRGHLGRWSTDEKQLAVVAPAIVDGQDRWQVRILNAESLEPRFTLSLPESFGQVVSMDWEPGGDRLLLSVARQDKYQLYIIDPKLPEPKRVPIESGSAAAPNPAHGTWSPDGAEILFRSVGDPSGGGSSFSRLHVMKADGTAVRTIWEPGNGAFHIYGTAWQRPTPVLVAAVPAPVPPKPEVAAQAEPKKPEVEKPEAPAKPATPPVGGQVTLRVPGPSKKVHAPKLFVVDRSRSPVSVPIASPSDENFIISVPVLPSKTWAGRRQGVGITLEMEDGSLYRGTMIYSGAPWATIQGRAKGAKVRLIDGKQLPPDSAGFKQGFKLTLRRDGALLIVSVNDKELISRPVLASAVKRCYLTLEGFDAGKTYFPLGNVYYQPAALAQPTP